MKIKKILLLAAACLLSFCVLCGLLVYAFHLQGEQERKDLIMKQESEEDLASDNSKPQDNSENETQTEVIADGNEAVVNQDPAKGNTQINNTPTPTLTPAKQEEPLKPIVLGFAGDINLDESSKPVAKYDVAGIGILGGLSADLVEEMNTADVMMLNNEFSYSERGTKTPDKSYTFRANPSRVSILSEMGVDIVSLANNHALDYGPDALSDTFDTLDSAGIDYIGAGENLDRAKAPIYYTIGDKKIAYLAASRVVFSMDWYANDTRLGMIGTYDPTLFLASIKEAEANSDFVVVYLHWGVERKEYPEDYQRTLATQYIDAGADAVIGCHPHVLQGFEYYKGKPIAYSLGNFWFGGATKETGLLKLYLEPEGNVRMQMLPAMARNTYTSLMTEAGEKKALYDNLKKISYNVNIDENGFITPTE